MGDTPSRSVRRLESGDGMAYRQIRLAALKGAPEAFGSTYEAEKDRNVAHCERLVESGCVFGAFAGQRIIGMVGFRQASGEKVRHKGILWGMYVDPEYRSCGVGGQLVSAVLDHAREVVDLVTLTAVSENTPAIALYQAAGFREYGVEPRALRFGGRYFSETLMVCDLN